MKMLLTKEAMRKSFFSRRSLLTGSGALAAHAALTGDALSQGQMPMYLMPGPAAPYLGQVATRTVFPQIGVAAGGGGTNFNSRSRHKASVNITSLQILLPNWFVDASTSPYGINGNFAENSLGAVATVTASIEYPAGTFTEVKFSGSAGGTIPNGGSLLSDVTSVTIPAGAYFFVRVFWVNTGGVIAFGASTITNFGSDTTNGEAWHNGNGLADQTMSGTVVDANSGEFGYRPTAIIGMTTAPSVLLLGDSRMSGVGDAPGDGSGDIGEVARSIGPLFAYLNGGIPADRADKFVASHANRIAVGQYFSYVHSEYGINDCDLDTQTPAQVLANNLTIGGYFSGKPFFLQTISPHSNAGNTAPNNVTFNANRISYNTTLRAGSPPGVASVFDVASVDESSLNSGLWVAGYSTDGLHANATGTLAIKNSGIINTALIHRP
jgi:hypothetical protein